MTVIHATLGERAAAHIPDSLSEHPLLKDEIHQFHAGSDFWLKVRPFTKEFLTSASKLFEIHVYTAGARVYADQIVKIIDPDSQFFKGRVLTRDESPDSHKKFISRLFPFTQELVTIVDDSCDAWSNDVGIHQLFRIHRFMFFNIVHKDHQIVPAPNPLPEADGTLVDGHPQYFWINKRAWRDEELQFCLDALKRVHSLFFESQPQLPIKKLMTCVRNKVLKGTNLLFSGIVPKGQNVYK
jgi:FCP1-like phosphatase family protein